MAGTGDVKDVLKLLYQTMATRPGGMAIVMPDNKPLTPKYNIQKAKHKTFYEVWFRSLTRRKGGGGNDYEQSRALMLVLSA